MNKKNIKVGLPPNLVVPDLKELTSQETNDTDEYVWIEKTKSKSKSFWFYKNISPCFIKDNS